MKRLLVGLALSAMLGATPSMAGDAEEQRLRLTGNCPNCDLRYMTASGMDLSRANLQGANLQGANLSGAYLIDANLTGALLVLVNLTGAYLFGTNLSGANLSGANLSGAFFNITTNTDGMTLCRTIWTDGTLRNDSCPH